MEYLTSMKRALVFADGKGPDLIVDDMGAISEFLHIGVDAENYFEQNKKIPDLKILGYVKQSGWSSLFTSLIYRDIKDQKQSARAEFTPYYKALNTIVKQSLESNPKFFRDIAQGIVGATESTFQGRLFFKKLKPEKLLYTPVIQGNVYASVTDQFGAIIQSMIPDAIQKQSNIQIRGKKVAVIGFGSIGKAAAIALRDQGGAKLVICETDAKLALSANLQGFEVSELDEVLPLADVIIQTTKQKINISQIQKMKQGCVLGTLEVNQELETGILTSIPGVQIEIVKPGLDKYTFPNQKVLFLLQECKPMNIISSSAKCPGPLASSLLCSTALSLIDLWNNKEKYPKRITLMPEFVIEKTVIYNMDTQIIHLTKGSDSPDELFEQKIERPFEIREREKTIYIQEYLELQKLKIEVKNKESQFKRQAMKESISDQPLKDLHLGVDIGIDYLSQVQLTLTSYKTIIETLKNMKIEKVDLWPIIEVLRELLKYQYKSVKDVGQEGEISKTKQTLKVLGEQTFNITVKDGQKVHYEAIQQYLDAMRSVLINNDRSLASLRDVQYQTVGDLPACEGQKYESQDVPLLEIQKYTDESCLDLKRRRELRDQINYQFEMAKQSALSREKEQVCEIMKDIINKFLVLTANDVQQDKKVEDCQDFIQTFEYLDFYCDGKINPDHFKNELLSYDTLKRIVFSVEDYDRQLQVIQDKINDQQSKINELQDELNSLNGHEWSIGQRILKPAIIKSSTIEVKAGADEEQQPVKGLSPEMMEGYAQTLNKVIQGQTKNINFLGGDAKKILENVPGEQEPVLQRIPKQFTACLELNKLLNQIQNDLLIESQQTLCLLTNQPDLNHNLFQLELDKRDLLKGQKGDNTKQLQDLQVHLEDEAREKDDLKKANKVFMDEIDVKNKNILDLTQQLEEKNKELADKDNKINDLEQQLKDLQDKFKAYKNFLLIEINKLLNELKKASVPLQAETEVQQAIIENILQVQDKEDIEAQINSGLNGALKAASILRSKENNLQKVSKDSLDKLLQYQDLKNKKDQPESEKPQEATEAQQNPQDDLKLFDLEDTKQKTLDDLLDQLKQLLDENEKLKQENQDFNKGLQDCQNQLDDANKLTDDLRKERDDLLDKTNALEDENKNLKDENFNQLRELNKLQTRIECLLKEIQDLKDLYDNLKNQVQDAEMKAAKGTSNEKIYQVQYEEVNDKYKDCILKIQEQERYIKDLEQRLIEEGQKNQQLHSDYEKRLCEKDSEIQKRDKIIEELNKQISDQEALFAQIKEELLNSKTQHQCDQEEIERVKEQLNKLENLLQSERDKDLKKKLIKLQMENEDLKGIISEQKSKLQRLRELEAQVIKLECVNGSLIKELEVLRPQNSDYYRIKHENQHLNEELELLRKQLAQKGDILPQEGVSSEQGDQLRVQNQDLTQKIAETQNQIEGLNNQIKDSEGKRKALQQSNQSLMDEIDGLNQQVKDQEQEIQLMNQELDELRPLEEQVKNVNELQEINKQLEKKLEIAVQDENLRETLDQMQKKIQEAEENAEQKERWRSQVEELSTQLQENDQKIKEIDELIKSKAQDYALLRQANARIKELEVEINSLKSGEAPEVEPKKKEEDIGNMEEMSENFQEDIIKQKVQAVQENSLLKRISSLEGEKPMPYANIWKIFENLMDKKYEQDIADLQLNVQPRQMTQFMADYFIQQYGVKSIANKSLAQLLLALNNLYNENHQYGTLFCRFLQVYHPDPVDKILGCFLVKVRIQFNKLLENYQKKRAAAEGKQKQGDKKPQATWGRDSYEYAAAGGYIPLIEAFELTAHVFDKDRQLGANIMGRLLPEDQEARNEFSLFLLNWKITKTGKKPNELFQMFDKDQSGSVSTDEFVQGLKGTLDIWLTASEIEKLLNYIDQDKTGTIEYNEFNDKIQFLIQKYKNKEAWMCSKSQFLTAISDEYEAKRLRDFESLRTLFMDADEDKTGTLELKEFENLCKKIEPNITQTKILNMFNAALEKTKGQPPDVMSPEAFSITAMQFKLGGFGTGIFDASRILSGVARQEGEIDISKKNLSVKDKPVTSRKALAQKK